MWAGIWFLFVGMVGFLFVLIGLLAEEYVLWLIFSLLLALFGPFASL
jgi:hypothetical protein